MRTCTRSTLPRSAAALFTAVVVTAWIAEGAGAHVYLQPAKATTASTPQLVSSPLNEEPDAGTVKVEVVFPRSHPIAAAEPSSTDAWKGTVTTRTVKKPIKG